MDSFLNVKYKQVSVSDNYEDFLKFVGINVIMRKAALTISPICIVSREGDIYTLTMITPLKNVTTIFKPNEEFDEERVDGTKVKTVVTIEGNKIIQVQRDSNGNKLTNVRQYSADKIVMTTTADGWTGECKRIFEKIN